ncbi:hypothetical protein KIL84_016706, partial [Mauremys mutica]
MLQVLLCRMLGGSGRARYLSQGKRARALELLHVSTTEVLWGVQRIPDGNIQLQDFFT